MANPWFKFYGGEYLSDQKILSLSSAERSCWVTLLSYASLTSGVVKHISEEQIMSQAGVNPHLGEWEETKGVLEHFKRLKMIDIGKKAIRVKNWKKRQEVYSESWDRVKKWREKNTGNVTETLPSNGKKRVEENREDKKREEDKPHRSVSFLTNIPPDDLQELSTKYKISPKGIQSKAYDLKLYCEQNGKKYRNYRAFLENALRKDQVKLRTEYPLPSPTFKEEKDEPLTPEQEARNAEMLAKLGEVARGKTMV